MYKKVLIGVLLAVLVISGAYVANNFLISYFSLQSADPVVYVENGVSGTVIITDPYLNKTQIIDTGYYPFDAGSGVIVTSNGYVITAFHVVGDPQANAQQILKKMDDNDIGFYVEQAAVRQYISNYNPEFGKKLIKDNSTALGANLDNNMSYLTRLLVQKNLVSVKSDEQVIKVHIRTSTRVAYLDAQLVDVGDPASYDDVALLKLNSSVLNSVENLNSLNISSKKPTVGENIRIYGYPDNKVQTQSTIQSVTTGQLISTMPNSFGTVYYQTSAITSPGYSGGPVLNPQNNVMGIIIYELELTGQPNNQIISQSSLFLSSNYIIQICKKNNVPINVVA